MKERRNSSNSNNENTNDIRTGIFDYDGIFIGLNKNNKFYCGLRKGDEVTFINGYEAVNLVNGYLNEFEEIQVEFTKEVSRNNNDYEVATPVDYKI